VTTTPYGHAVARIFNLSLRQMLWSRRTIVLALVVGGPVVVAAIARLVQAGGSASLRVNGIPVGGSAIVGMMIWLLFVRFIVPVLGVFYGTALVADEVEDKTITYLFTRPIQRGAILHGKYLGYLTCTALVVLPAVVLVYVLLVPPRELAAGAAPLAIDLGVLAFGLAVYGALFGLIGALLKRPLLAGLVFAFGWEPVALVVPGYLRRFTVAYYLQSLVPHAMPSGGSASLLEAALGEGPSAAASLFWLLLVLGVSLYLAGRALERREYVLEQ
jgi:ABC-type transport system involved in multi-copper enzyme maturation permease subunit